MGWNVLGSGLRVRGAGDSGAGVVSRGAASRVVRLSFVRGGILFVLFFLCLFLPVRERV